MTLSNFADGWQRIAYRRLIRSLGDAARIDEQELLDLIAGKIDGADASGRAKDDGHEFGAEQGEPLTAYERLLATRHIVRDFRDLSVWDRCREYPTDVYGWPADKSRGMSLGTRDWARIDTIVLHTAAVELGPDRGLGVPSHALVDRYGGLVLQHYLRAYLASAHRANSYSVSLEISGERTIRDGQIDAARAWCRFAVETLAYERALVGAAGPIKVIAHRMSHDSRVNDSDIAIWREVGEHCIDELGCELGDVVGSGRPIPPGWWSEGRAEREAVQA